MPRSPRLLRVLLKTAAVWELLDRLDISQNELARRCGITRGYLTFTDTVVVPNISTQGIAVLETRWN